MREEELVRQFGEILKQVRIPHELARKLTTVLRESQADKEKFVRTSMLRLQQQQMLLRSKLDRVYEDRLSDGISDELWTTKSSELQEELRRVRAEMERDEGASQAYETAGLQILTAGTPRVRAWRLECAKQSQSIGSRPASISQTLGMEFLVVTTFGLEARRCRPLDWGRLSAVRRTTAIYAPARRHGADGGERVTVNRVLWRRVLWRRLYVWVSTRFAL